MNPPAIAIQRAIQLAAMSPCQSKRGAVIWFPENTLKKKLVLVAAGYNNQPQPFMCDGTKLCRQTCRKRAVHAEQAALILSQLYFTESVIGAEMLHVKVVDGLLVPSGGPSCVECSKLLLVAGISRMWLFHADGWRAYDAVEFHQLSIEGSNL